MAAPRSRETKGPMAALRGQGAGKLSRYPTAPGGPNSGRGTGQAGSTVKHCRGARGAMAALRGRLLLLLLLLRRTGQAGLVRYPRESRTDGSNVYYCFHDTQPHLGDLKTRPRHRASRQHCQALSNDNEFRPGIRQDVRSCPMGRATGLHLHCAAFPTVLPNPAQDGVMPDAQRTRHTEAPEDDGDYSLQGRARRRC